MTLDEIPQLYRNVWSVYEAFRRLGFEDDDITYVSARTVLPMFLTGAVSDVDHLHVVLTAQDHSFIVTMEPLDRPLEEAQKELQKLRLAVRDKQISQEDLLRLWTESKMGDLAYFTRFTVALMEHGFVLPAFAN